MNWIMLMSYIYMWWKPYRKHTVASWERRSWQIIHVRERSSEIGFDIKKYVLRLLYMLFFYIVFIQIQKCHQSLFSDSHSPDCTHYRHMKHFWTLKEYNGSVVKIYYEYMEPIPVKCSVTGFISSLDHALYFTYLQTYKLNCIPLISIWFVGGCKVN